MAWRRTCWDLDTRRTCISSIKVNMHTHDVCVRCSGRVCRIGEERTGEQFKGKDRAAYVPYQNWERTFWTHGGTVGVLVVHEERARKWCCEGTACAEGMQRMDQ